MSEALPPPPVPADLDLRDFPFMPLDVLRLRDSDLATLATGDEFKAAVLLWCVAWHQVPCGSVPNDERWLARQSGAGANWRRVKGEALRGFVEHSDGRLYHPVIVEKALASWRRKCEQRVKTLKARIAMAEKRLQAAASVEDRAHQQAILDDLHRSLPQAIERSVTGFVTKDVTRNETNNVTAGSKSNVTKAKGEGEGEGESYSEAKASGGKPPAGNSWHISNRRGTPRRLFDRASANGGRSTVMSERMPA
jgi:uncharacterized protein DUF1376